MPEGDYLVDSECIVATLKVTIVIGGTRRRREREIRTEHSKYIHLGTRTKVEGKSLHW